MTIDRRYAPCPRSRCLSFRPRLSGGLWACAVTAVGSAPPRRRPSRPPRGPDADPGPVSPADPKPGGDSPCRRRDRDRRERPVAPVGLVAPPDDHRPPLRPRADRPDLGPATGEMRHEPFLDLRTGSSRSSPTTTSAACSASRSIPTSRPTAASSSTTAHRCGRRRGRLGPHEHAERAPCRARPTPIAPTRTSERIVLQFEQPQFNHSGGGLGFGPDGCLYLGTGDGGGHGRRERGSLAAGQRPGPRRSSTASSCGIDVVDGKRAVRHPDDNPFVTAAAGPRSTPTASATRGGSSWEPDGARRLLVSDVGYGRYEEVDVVGTGGNYGWRDPRGRPLPRRRRAADRHRRLPTSPAAAASRSSIRSLEYAHGGSASPSSAATCIAARRSRRSAASTSSPTSAPDPDNNLSVPRGSLLVADAADGAGAPGPGAALVLRRAARAVRDRDGRGCRGRAVRPDADGLGPVGTTGEVLKLVPPGSSTATRTQRNPPRPKSATHAHCDSRFTMNTSPIQRNPPRRRPSSGARPSGLSPRPRRST